MENETQERLSNFVDLLLDAVFMVDVHGKIVYVSAACERILGYTPEEMIGRQIIDFVVPEDRARTREEAVRVMAAQPRIGFENRYIHKNGHQVHIMWSARLHEGDQLRLGVARDITERKLAEERQTAIYAISEAAHTATDIVALLKDIHRIIERLVPIASFNVVMFNSDTGQCDFPYQIDYQGNHSDVPETLVARLHADFILAKQPDPLPETESLPALVPVPSSSFHQGESWFTLPLMSGKTVIGALVMRNYSWSTYSDRDKELLQFISTQVTTAIERKQMNTELLRAARHDELTGLPNRRLFHDRIKAAFDNAGHEKGQAAVFYIDINDFKHVNDSLGHAAGDYLLREVAIRLRQCMRSSDMVARIGGDEFAVLLEGVKEQGDVFAVAEKMRAAVRQPMDIAGSLLNTQLSIGIALYPEHGASGEQLLMYADKAMYAEKRRKLVDRERGLPESGLPTDS